MSKPVTLPTDFLSEWARVPSLDSVTGGSRMDNPFSDVHESSRVTASGFTMDDDDQTEVGIARMNLEDAIHNSRRTSERLAESGKHWGFGSINRKSRQEKKDLLDHASNLETLASNYGDISWQSSRRKGSSKSVSGIETVLKSPDQGLRHQAQTQGETSQQNADRRMSEEKTWEDEASTKYATLEDFTQFTRLMMKSASINPHESASSVGAGQQQKRQGTSSKLSGIIEMESDVEGTVIGGFDMSAKEKMREVDSYVNIAPIRGLPRVFLNDRLNFLSHIHSALFKLLTNDDGYYPTEDSLEILMDSRKTWGNDPSTQLLETVMDHTFDSRTGVVKSNPFRLPILEPTMQLSSKIMHMSLDQLHREFETEWFNTVKTMTTPKFQSKYEKRKYRTRAHRKELSSSPENRTTSSSSGKNSRRNSSNDKGSIVSGLFGR